MSRVSIFGSCATRDVFRLFPEGVEVVSYHSRSSVISVMSPPLEVEDGALEWSSGFARKVVLADLRKTFFDDLEAAAPDVLIIDLMSERFDLLRAGDTYATRSWELVASGFPARCAYRLERVARETNATQEIWLAEARRFARALRIRFGALPLVLHRAYWTPWYRDGTAIRRFPRSWRRWIGRRNRMLAACHAHLEELLPGLVVVEPRRAHVADPRHRWGIGSSHYELAYYDDIRQQLGLGPAVTALAA